MLVNYTDNTAHNPFTCAPPDERSVGLYFLVQTGRGMVSVCKHCLVIYVLEEEIED